MKKLWFWIWYSPNWHWVNIKTGERRYSPPLFKVVILAGFVVEVIGLFILALQAFVSK